MPIIPILPAKAVIKVLPFFVIRLFKLSPNAVLKDMDFIFPFSFVTAGSTFSSVFLNGLESSITLPSKSLMILEEYCSANSGLWVTIIIKRSLEISFNSSIIWTLVVESKAPVGSSAKRISGSLIKARAIATRCIWPPDIWFGFL